MTLDKVDYSHDGKKEEVYECQHCEGHVHEWAGTCTDEHDGFVDDVNVVVDVKAVSLSLGAAYPGKTAVERSSF